MRKIILLILIIVFVNSCKLPMTVSETIPCNNCSDKLLSIKSLTECKSICQEQFEKSKGSIIFGQEVTKLTGYKKSIHWSNGVKTISCVCSYK
jgi:hypothetical protein